MYIYIYICIHTWLFTMAWRDRTRKLRPKKGTNFLYRRPTLTASLACKALQYKFENLKGWPIWGLISHHSFCSERHCGRVFCVVCNLAKPNHGCIWLIVLSQPRKQSEASAGCLIFAFKQEISPLVYLPKVDPDYEHTLAQGWLHGESFDFRSTDETLRSAIRDGGSEQLMPRKASQVQVTEVTFSAQIITPKNVRCTKKIRKVHWKMLVQRLNDPYPSIWTFCYSLSRKSGSSWHHHNLSISIYTREMTEGWILQLTNKGGSVPYDHQPHWAIHVFYRWTRGLDKQLEEMYEAIWRGSFLAPVFSACFVFMV